MKRAVIEVIKCNENWQFRVILADKSLLLASTPFKTRVECLKSLDKLSDIIAKSDVIIRSCK